MSEDRIDKAMEVAVAALNQINSHERVCDERYNGIHIFMTNFKEDMSNLKKDVASFMEKVERGFEKNNKTINAYVISTLVFCLLTVGSFASYLWLKLDDEKENRVKSDQVSKIQQQLNHITDQIDRVKKK